MTNLDVHAVGATLAVARKAVPMKVAPACMHLSDLPSKKDFGSDS
jgi:hypothetical protein